ncbi:MAG: ABC transporter substrate-binding protein [Steroidobacteraceae bacterium]|nr:ABC transporter substrate-binding protein [Deltaproteobacteria bacterium]
MKLGKTLAALTAAIAIATTSFAAETIKVGGIWDLTGVTADVGKPFAEGVQDAIAYVNEKGGINGRKIELLNVDYAYKIPQANAAYKKFVEQDKVVMINGWGTGDTEALKEIISKDKVPYFSASYSGHLTDPAKTPYNFFVGASYSDQIRGFLQYVKKEWKGKGAPKVAFIYPNHGFGKAPIEAGRQYAKELGIELVHEEVIPASFQDVTSNLLNMQKKAPDYAYVQTTVSWCAVLLKDAKKLGIKTKFFLGNYGMTEALPLLAKDAAEGVYGMTTQVPYGTNVPGMKLLTDWNRKHPSKATRDTVYVRGWTYGLIWAEGLKIADKIKQLTGEGVKKALETLKNFDTGGLVPPITYTSTDHRPTTKSTIYVIKGGKMTKVEDVETPRKKEWLGL